MTCQWWMVDFIDGDLKEITGQVRDYPPNVEPGMCGETTYWNDGMLLGAEVWAAGPDEALLRAEYLAENSIGIEVNA